MIPGARPPSVPELVRAQDRMTFLYLEHAVISRDASAITSTDERGTIHVPAAALGALLLACTSGTLIGTLWSHAPAPAGSHCRADLESAGAAISSTRESSRIGEQQSRNE